MFADGLGWSFALRRGGTRPPGCPKMSQNVPPEKNSSAEPAGSRLAQHTVTCELDRTCVSALAPVPRMMYLARSSLLVLAPGGSHGPTDLAGPHGTPARRPHRDGC